jgi:hypothetical protein
MSVLFGTYNSTPYNLSCPPDFGNAEEREDSTIKSPFEGGYEHTRPRFTRARKTFSLPYPILFDADKTVIENLLNATGNGADMFVYSNFRTAASHTVRFLKLPKFENVSCGIWSCTIELREV